MGTCYFLSALGVVAHLRPQLLMKIFHPQSKNYQENGMYTVMFYRNRKPVLITIDDCFPCNEDVRLMSFILNIESRLLR